MLIVLACCLLYITGTFADLCSVSLWHLFSILELLVIYLRLETMLHLCSHLSPSSGAFSSGLHVVFKAWMHHRFIQENIMFCTLYLSYQILFPFLITFLTALEYWADNDIELTSHPKVSFLVVIAVLRAHVHDKCSMYLSFSSVHC